MFARLRQSGFLRKITLALVLGLFGLSQVHADLVAIDPVTGDVTFDPTAITVPILGAIAAAIVAATSIWLVSIGVKWVLRYARGRA